MSNYKWVKESERFVDLRSEDFSYTSFYLVPSALINPLLLSKLSENGIEYWPEEESYELSPKDARIIKISAPLYQFNIDTGNYDLLQEEYTDTAIDPLQKEWVKETFSRCAKELAQEQGKIFEKEFAEKSLDNGISSVITITSVPNAEPNYFYEQYVPKNYIKVCEKNCYFTECRHNVVFIKKIDAKGKSVMMRVPDFYKGLVIGKGGENIRRVAKIINARQINVI